MQATRATLGVLPAARMTGFHLVAAKVAMYRAARTLPRPRYEWARGP